MPSTLDKKIKELERLLRINSSSSIAAATTAAVASGVSTVAEYAHASNMETTVTKNVQTNPAINWSDYYNQNGTLTQSLPSEIETIPAGYVSPWINFALQSGVNVLAALNMLNTYMELKQEQSYAWKVVKGIWLGIHGAVALGSKIYSWLSGEELQSTFSGLSTGNATYTSFENGAKASLAALLFEGGCTAASLHKLSAKHKAIDNIDRIYKDCLEQIGSMDMDPINNTDENLHFFYESSGAKPNVERLAKMIFARYPELKIKKNIFTDTKRDYKTTAITFDESMKALESTYPGESRIINKEFKNAGAGLDLDDVMTLLYPYMK